MKTITLSDLSGRLKEHGKAAPEVFMRAALATARRIQAAIVTEIGKRGITDTGALAMSYRARSTDDGAICDSDCPYAGIIEMGARPHPVGKAGRDAIKGWAMRKLGLDEKDAESLSWGVAKKIAEVGQKPTYVVRGVTKQAGAWLAQEMQRELGEAV